MKGIDSQTALTSMLWRFAERCGAQAMGFVVSIILARLLMPEEYGTVALITVLTSILYTFVDCGLNGAIVQKKAADALDYSTVFYFSFCTSILLYCGVFFSAPYIARFYGRQELTPMIRVLALTFFIGSFKSGQTTYARKNLLFKKYFFATIGGTFLSGIVGACMAFWGFGAWALIAQNMLNDVVDTLILWYTVGWRPQRMFSLQRMKGLWSYSWKMLTASLLENVYNNMRSLIIGKLYSSADLAFYNKARSLPNLIISNINGSIDSVLLPVMATAQDETIRLKEMTRRAIRTSTYVMAPLLIGLAVCSVPLINLLYTEKWLPCVPFLRIFCITFIFFPVHTANLNAIQAMGRSDLFLKLEITKKIIGLIVLFSTMWFGVMAMAYSLLFTSITAQIINSWPNKKLLNYGYRDQLRDILPGVMLAATMGLCIYPIQWLDLPDILILAIQVPFGAIFYVVGSVVFKLDSFQYLLGIIKPYATRFQHKK